MKDKMVVSTNVAPLYSKPEFSSEMISQALMWEIVFIEKKLKNWHYIHQKDGYKGWIHDFYLIEEKIKINKLTILLDRFTPAYKKISDKVSPCKLLSF